MRWRVGRRVDVELCMECRGESIGVDGTYRAGQTCTDRH